MSNEHGMIMWDGKIDGNEIHSTYVWTKKRWWKDARQEKVFLGKLKE